MKEKNKDLQSFNFVSVLVSCTRSVSHLLEEHKRTILLYNASQVGVMLQLYCILNILLLLLLHNRNES